MDAFDHPLATRYATAPMRENFSAARRARLWRELWIALAQAQHELGLEVGAEQVDALRAAVDEIDFDQVARIEEQTRHDVMAHIHHFGERAGASAEKILHLGATSCFVTDNAELVLMRDGLTLLQGQLVYILDALASFARSHREVATLAYTHFQPAQLTTVGKRACLWALDFAYDLQSVAHVEGRLSFRGAKGTTGTQASYLALFDGDRAKVRALDDKVAAAMGFDTTLPVTGQTYTRKLDVWVVDALAQVCASAAKFASDMRLLAHKRELLEPLGRKQVGSSAMAYKRNPMRSERICSLARFVHSLATSPPQTHANQWLERTLDDSANRRLVLTQAFLATDAVLNLVADVVAGIEVNREEIDACVRRELPFMITESVIMAAVRAGESRQVVHESIREHSRQVTAGANNDLVERMRADPQLAPHVPAGQDPADYVGSAPAQVDEFVDGWLPDALAPFERLRGAFAPKVRV